MHKKDVNERSARTHSIYKQFENELNMSGLIYPMSVGQITEFEYQNKNISINVLYYEEDTDSIIVLRQARMKIVSTK